MATNLPEIDEFKQTFEKLKEEIKKVIVGHEEIISSALTSLFSGGHILLEGVPGLGKTLLVKTLSECLNLSFSRIQFTPDLMPADIIGTNIIMEDESSKRFFQFQKGPIFANIILADEINRATPKTQSALLEAMQEGAVTAGGSTRPLPVPFFVLATQNPIEMEGTYPLPEAQLDRFIFKLKLNFPPLSDINEIIERTTQPQILHASQVIDAQSTENLKGLVRQVLLASHVKEFVSSIILATHPDWEHSNSYIKRYVRYGSSPRGAQALVLGGKVNALIDGRFNVSFDDIKVVALPALRHRIILNFEGEAEGINTDDVIIKALETAEIETSSSKKAYIR